MGGVDVVAVTDKQVILEIFTHKEVEGRRLECLMDPVEGGFVRARVVSEEAGARWIHHLQLSQVELVCSV